MPGAAGEGKDPTYSYSPRWRSLRGTALVFKQPKQSSILYALDRVPPGTALNRAAARTVSRPFGDWAKEVVPVLPLIMLGPI